MERILTQKIETEYTGRKVETYLKERFGLTKAQISSLKYRTNGICLNGRKVRVTETLTEGDILTLHLEEENGERVSAHLESCEYPIKVLYEDADLICVWKPTGMVVHPAGGHYRDSMSNYLKAYFEKRGQQVCMRSIGRLDRDACGILVFAKNQIAAAKLWNQREDGTFTKEYLALCEGIFPPETFEREQIVDLPLMRAEKYKMTVSRTGKSARTYYQAVKKIAASYTLVRLHLQTGRMHQIRVHMSAIGHPLVGDPIYGNGIEGKNSAQLCAWKCEFIQPFTGEKICVQDHEMENIQQ